MSSKLILVSATLVCVLSSGCATAKRTPVYDSTQVGHIMHEQVGEIIAVQEVVIKAPASRAGSPGAGAQIGGAAAAAAVTGNPIAIAAAAGRVIGSAAGAAAADNQRGEEITVLLKDGRTVVLVQVRGDVPLAVGDPVKVVSGTTHDRVVRDEGRVQVAEGSRFSRR